MGTVNFTGPPDPDGKCVICLMHAKQAQWVMYQAEVKEGLQASGEKQTWIPWPPGLRILDGRYRGVSGETPQLGVIDGLCWDHVAGLQANLPSFLDRATTIPPGLIKGSN